MNRRGNTEANTGSQCHPALYVCEMYLECFYWGMLDNGCNVGAHDAGYMLRDEGIVLKIHIESVE